MELNVVSFYVYATVIVVLSAVLLITAGEVMIGSLSYEYVRPFIALESVVIVVAFDTVLSRFGI